MSTTPNVTQLNELATLASCNLNDCKMAVSGIRTYRWNSKGLAFSSN